MVALDLLAAPKRAPRTDKSLWRAAAPSCSELVAETEPLVVGVVGLFATEGCDLPQ